VYSFGTVGPSWEQDVQAAVLSCGGAACLRSAARLWGLLPDTDAVEVLVARGVSAKLENATVHWTAKDSETATRRGIRTTSPLLTLAMLGGVAPRDDVADASSRALASRLVSPAGLAAAVERFGGPGSRGPRLLRSILREWELGKRPPDSVLETRMATLLRRFKLPRAEFQFEVHGDDGAFLGRVDFAYPAPRLAIEVDGGEHHSSAEDRQRDARRRNALSIAGWTVLVFTWTDVVRAGHDVAAAILAQHETCRAQALSRASTLQLSRASGE